MKAFCESLNISEKVNITEAKEASERMMRFMTQDADVVKFMTDMKFDYKDLHMVNNLIRFTQGHEVSVADFYLEFSWGKVKECVEESLIFISV